jgi:hypothetical protein
MRASSLQLEKPSVFETGYLLDTEFQGGRKEILQLLTEASVAQAWADFDIPAVDNRVFWEETTDGVFVYYRESVE